MTTIRQSKDVTATQAKFLVVGPLVVKGVCCECSASLSIETYGIISELKNCTLKCEKCDK